MWAVLFGSRRGAMLQGSLAFGLSFLESGLRPPLRSATAPNFIKKRAALSNRPLQFSLKKLLCYSVLINFLTDSGSPAPVTCIK